MAGAERVAVFPYTRGASWRVELLGLGLAWGGETAYVSLDEAAGRWMSCGGGWRTLRRGRRRLTRRR